MRIAIKLPQFILTTIQFLLFNWLVFFGARLAMTIFLWSNISNLPKKDIAYALYIGGKFDMRIAVFMTLPLFLSLTLGRVDANVQKIKTWLTLLYGLIFSCALWIYATDFGFFLYTRSRLDATFFEFFKDLSTSIAMVKESYPLGWIILFCAFLLFLYLKVTRYILYKHQKNASPITLKKRLLWVALAIIALFLLGYGQIKSNLFPLRWSNAYFSINSDIVALGLNPVQNIYDTYRTTSNIPPDIESTRESYPRVAQWLNVRHPDPKTLNFLRTEAARKDKEPINVIVILIESLAWPRTSLAPGKDDPTPNLKALAKDALVFSRFFSPARTTARAIFTAMTGIPDVNRGGGTSSRNQKIINQRLIMNDFNGYEKYYLIGGSASWANIRGVLEHNVKGLKLIEEGYWKSPNINVWGISDLALFRESIDLFNKTREPFIAVIQTAGFHKPYTIPKDNANFTLADPTPETLRNYGYADKEEYNSMRFSDHALGVFFLLAQEQPWFKNTVFAILGDHGLREPSENMTPGYLACKLQDSHIPLLLYSPGRIAPGEYRLPCGQTDLFPTLASLAGIEYRNQTLGRNLFDPANQTDAKQFISGSSEAFLRLVQGNYCYIKEEAEGLYDITSGELKNLLETDPERAKEMRQSATDFFNASKYMLYHNK